MAASDTGILVINPGSTSTKVALFRGETKIAEKNAEHAIEDLKDFGSMFDQLFYREGVIRRFVRENGWNPEKIDAVVGRGGLLQPVEGGVYRVSGDMLTDLRSGRYGVHASNLGAHLAAAFAERASCPAFIVDPVVVDELDDAAKVSGHPDISRRSIFHALNQKSVARYAADELGKTYEQARLIVAHMGGGITVGAHIGGRVIDVNNGLYGDGPFTPERSGSLPPGDLISLCFNSGMSEAAVRKMLKGSSGIAAYCGTTDVRELIKYAEDENRNEYNDFPEKPSIVLEALCRQIAQEICSHGATLEGKVDAVILTGGIAYNKVIIDRLTEMCGWMATIITIPGEQEMKALAAGSLRVLNGEEKAKNYQK